MKIRKATVADLGAMQQLYCDTIRTVNAHDYTPEQIETWVSGVSGIPARFGEQECFVAEIDEQLVGFSSLYPNGYLDFMYVHKDFQGRGIAKALLKTVEELARELSISEVTSDVSITARPFFTRHGYAVIREYTKVFKNQEFRNTWMKKKIL